MADKADQKQSINFLRGVPAEVALSHIVTQVAEGYEKVIRKYGTDVLQYGHFTGFKPLREQLGKLHNVSPERVVIGNGGLEIISLFFKSIPRESDVLIEETSYDRVLIDLKRYGHRLTGIKMTPDGIDLDQFENLVKGKSFAAFYGIPFHHNPTGINYTKGNREAVERICRENNILCVWDICYQILRYDGKVNDSIEVSDWGPILTSSFTKTISPGTKCGYMIVPEKYVAHFSDVISNTRINPNLPTQAFIADFIESGRYDDYLKYLRDLYKPSMDVLNKALNEHFPDVSPVELTGGFFAVLTFGNIQGNEESTFVEKCNEAGVGIAAAWNAVAPNYLEEMKNKGLFVRLTFPAFEPDDIEWGISKLKEISSSWS